ncbi:MULTISPECIES: DUF4345 family protein [unclassified Novosphingobium]|uniref:DUF4345 family protein n=1 Tax=unclassified Novosphingobium TaxID=2644732 RepID=UPI000ED005ED|nr:MULTISPECIES: DUF4345 family protein [unclassified Novosphingobium]HCF24194.1 hypothetical protein [Novosphingobium sp.]HQV02113.1 DUF4345 family protein [Novosphingobium sp.]
MRLILTALVFLFGLFDLFMGLNFLLNPAQTAAGFGLEANGTQGLSTLRADFTAFFGVVAVCMMIGAWRRNADLLLVPMAVMGIAVTVRALSLGLDGTYPGWQVPMVVEALHVILLLAAWRVLPHHKIEELTS